eukprot:gnl/MRDRNA2_/MRDRNA2_138376_c0_seq1.p1 gnl/MRDRNA2_/MRDRNA2_138376_c0~~gnl/MRDRNA2_/MRDRNA2_138376_c0_seq1.p1  ORF type:complete len:656 (-),score=135.42 gnl/MRDRNA2_/MRDRNA2_138376_c0_seq1:10-1977(-)
MSRAFILQNAGKVALETVQVGRHVCRLGSRPIEKAAHNFVRVSRDSILWVLRSPLVAQYVGQTTTRQVEQYMDTGLQVADQITSSFSHQTLQTVLQQGSDTTSDACKSLGVPLRVMGPFDQSWAMLEVLEDLREVRREESTSTEGIHITPQQFVRLMRDASKVLKRRGPDQVKEYVDRMVDGGRLTCVGPPMFEKKLYTDMTRIIVFAFDRAIAAANGIDWWGHELRVAAVEQGPRGNVSLNGAGSTVGESQLSAIIDQIIESDNQARGGVSVLPQGLQRQICTNCAIIIFQLLEDMISEERMQISILGHSLNLRLDPQPIENIRLFAPPARRCQINEDAIQQLIEALLDDEEINLVFVPDMVEAMLYRHALHIMVRAVEEFLARLRIQLFGIEVRMWLQTEDATPTDWDQEDAIVKSASLSVMDSDIIAHLARIEEEKRIVDEELNVRGARKALPSSDASAALPGADAEHDEEHEFQKLAAQERLARSLSLVHTVPAPANICYSMIADFEEYPLWMPWCTSGKNLAPPDPSGFECEVSFGFDAGAMGTIGDTVLYRVTLKEPEDSKESIVGTKWRVVADTVDGFRYGSRLVYDWRFRAVNENETEVKLDMFFCAKSVLFLPVWDSIQNMVVNDMMKAFMTRSKALMEDPQAKAK